MSEKFNQSFTDEVFANKNNSLDEELSLEFDENDIAFTGYKKSKEASKYSIEMTMANLLFETLSSSPDSEVNKENEKHRKTKKSKKIKLSRDRLK